MQHKIIPELIAFGAAIRKLRLQRDLSQEKLAYLCDLDRTYIGGIERGERNVSLLNIHKLASALAVSPSAFFSEILFDE